MADGAPAGSVFRRRSRSDLAGFEQFLRAHYAHVSLGPVGDPGPFVHRHDAVGTDRFAVSRLRTSLGYRARLPGMDGQFAVASVRAGGFSSMSERHGELACAPGDLALTPPVGDVAWTSDPIDVDLVLLDGAAVAAYAADVCGLRPDDLRVTGLSPRSAGLTRHWDATVAHVRDDVLGNPSTAGSPIVLDSAFRMLASALLTTFPTTADDRSVRGAVPAARLDDVVDHLHAHADRPVGPADVAAVAGVPAREVVAALQRRRGTHPARVLWNARLLGVRRDLQDIDPVAGPPVAVLAGRWGFTHLGRFRVAYEKAFGERPEDTARR